MHLSKEGIIKKIIKQALEEDIGKGDLTTFLSVSYRVKTKVFIVAREKGILCGINIAKEVFKHLDHQLKFKSLKKDADEFTKGDKIAKIEGKACSILAAERVALNFLSLLSGIATCTKGFIERVKGTRAKIMDTRKTTPNLRILEKYAVKMGGGKNHRYNLDDGILIKDNHLRASGIIRNEKINEDALQNLIELLRASTNLPLEIEVENLGEFKKVIKYKPDIVMLDNFNLSSLKRAVKFRNKYFPKTNLEASGGINLKNIRNIAKSGIDFISVGAITHSPRSIDFSLEIAHV